MPRERAIGILHITFSSTCSQGIITTGQHTLSAQQLVLPGEHAAQLEALRAELRAEHQPQTTTEELLVNELAEQYWRLRRMRGIEATILGAPADELERGFRLLPMVQRTMAAAERGFHKALKALHDLQKQHQKQQKEVGFVPQKRTQPQERLSGAERRPAEDQSNPAGQSAAPPEHAPLDRAIPVATMTAAQLSSTSCLVTRPTPAQPSADRNPATH